MMAFHQLKCYFPKNRSHLFANLIITLFVCFTLPYFGIFRYILPEKQQLPPWASVELIQEYHQSISQSEDGNLIAPKSPCVLSLLEPFNPEILHLFNKQMKPIDCAGNKKYPLIFESSVEPYPRMIPVMNQSRLNDLGIRACCFRNIVGLIRIEQGVIDASLGWECKYLSLQNETRMPKNWEFVTVECDGLASKNSKRVVDIHAFPYPTKRKPDNITTGRNGSGLLNVLILGMDAMSHLNFRRTMPEVHEFLTKNLSALEFMGYHKIGENTLPNIGPLLTNSKVIHYGNGSNDLRLGCETEYMDNCPFLWKRFKLSGYTTLFGEDTFGMNIFASNRKGFYHRPVDHYFLTFQAAAPQISHNKNGYSPFCFGPRSAFQVLLNYAEKLAISAGSRPYFQYVHSSSITHEFINGPRLIVKHLLKTLQFFQQRSFLNNTLLILLSDHGSRINEIRAHPQGYLEDKLPFLYFVVPEWFQKMYPKAYSNLQTNTRRLITPRDVYKTLEDILPTKNGLNLDNLETDTGTGNKSGSPGISLFQQIPLSRTCETAHIPEEFCICNITLGSAMARDEPMVVEGAQATVKHINSLLRKGDKNEGTLCANLTLDGVIRAEGLKTIWNGQKLVYRLVFRTMPGNATFEARVSKRKMKSRQWVRGVEVDRVTRLNKYKNQSECIYNANLKPFCYCKV